MAAKKPASFTVRAGSVEVPVYFREVAKGVGKYQEWTLVFYDAAGKRVRRSFADREKAQAEAERVAAALSRGQAEAVEFTAADAAIYSRAIHIVKPHGVSLLGAVTEWSDARTKLPSGSTLPEVVLEFSRRHPSGAPKKTVSEVVTELVANAEARNLSEEHTRDLRNRLARFADAFQCPLASVTPKDMAEWVLNLKSDGKPLSNRSKFNFQRTIVGLFLFARRRRYIGRDLADDMREYPMPEPEPTVTEVFTPAEMAKILGEAPDDILPALAIGAFAGLRTKEIHRLEWGSVKLSQGIIVVDAGKSKTASRRTVPMQPNLIQWLTPHVKESGQVSPAPTDRAMNHRFARVSARVGIKWRHNALRHSFCSYRLAVTKNAAATAHEAGNSPAMIHRHYHALSTEDEGQAWFSIVPARPANVIPLPREATG